MRCTRLLLSQPLLDEVLAVLYVDAGSGGVVRDLPGGHVGVPAAVWAPAQPSRLSPNEIGLDLAEAVGPDVEPMLRSAPGADLGVVAGQGGHEAVAGTCSVVAPAGVDR